MRASVVLTPAESKRLLAKAVAKMDDVRSAMEKAYIILCSGSTTALVAQELFGIDLDVSTFTCGLSISGVLCNSDRAIRGQFPLIAYKGKLVDATIDEALNDFHRETVILKGANAVDRDGFVGIITSGYNGGTLAKAIGTFVSQGLRIICPVGLEKAVFSVPRAARYTGGKRFDYSMGADYGLFVLSTAEVITEVQAIGLLSGARAFHVASGGIGGSEGAVILAIEGSNKEVGSAIEVINGVKGEPAQKGVRMKCPGQTEAAGTPKQCKYVNCAFFDLEEQALPLWLRSS
jgi:hypothetical protein